MSAVVLAHPEWTNRGLEWVAAFDNCDLLDSYAAAANLKKTVPAPAWACLAGMMVLILREGFGVSRKRHRTRAQIADDRQEREEARRARKVEKAIEANRRKIEIVRALIEMKRTAGRHQFEREARRRFNIEYGSERAALMPVAALYRERTAIWQRVSVDVMSLLAALSAPANLRQEFEKRIEANERLQRQRGF
jgi:hypothetical protein